MKSILLLLFVVFLSLSSFGQDMPKVIPPSPTAMQFQRFGDYPVNHFNGLPQIDIPLYTIKTGDVELPISISYHASGSRPNEPRGLLGQGWVLNYGGQISREIRDKPDELYPFQIPSVAAASIPYWDQGYRQTEFYLAAKYKDMEHDVYSYSCNGLSGKFINTDNGPLLFPYKNIQIGGTLITDENGIRYNFGGSGAEEYGEYFDPRLNGALTTPATTWHLSAISSGTNPNDGISIQYQPHQTYNEFIDSKQWIFDDAWELDDMCINTEPFCGCVTARDALIYSNANWGLRPEQSSIQIKYNAIAPSRIDFNGGYILFQYNPTTKVLDKLTVFSLKGEIVKSVSFVVSPFPSAAGVSTYSRFKLSSLSINDNLNNKVNTYTFNYYNENSIDAVPWDYSDYNDYWGFFNNSGGNGFPHYTSFLSKDATIFNRTIGTSIKTANEETTKAYTLNKIGFPTGGYTLFEYELNKTENASLFNFASTLGGGLRVKSIRNYIGDEMKSEKTFTYQRGNMPITPHPSYYMNSKYGYLYRGGNAGPMWFRRNFYSKDPQINFSPFGSSVVYPQVTETETSDNSEANRIIRYQYDYEQAIEQNPLDYPNSSGYGVSLPHPLKYYSTNAKPWAYGNLLSKTVIGPNSSVTESYEYEEVIRGSERDFILETFAFPEAPISTYEQCFVPGMGNSTLFFNTFYYNNWDCYYNFADRTYISGCKRLKTKGTSYSNTSPYAVIGGSTDYYYDNPNYDLPTHSITSNSKGEEIKKVFKRPYDFMSTNPALPNVYNQMIDRNILTPVVEQHTYKGTTLLESIRTNYDGWYIDTWGSMEQLAILSPRKIETRRGVGAWEPRIIYDALDSKGNVTTVHKDGNLKHTYIWGYGKEYPVAEVVNADYSTASSYINQGLLDNLATTDAAMRTELNKIRTGLATSKSLVSTFTFKPLVGMTSQTDPSGRVNYFEYDAASRLLHIKDQYGNILKKYSYNYFDGTTALATAAQWQNTSNSYCEKCKGNTDFVTGIYKQQQKDVNTLSPTYNQTRWLDINDYTHPCVSTASEWVPTGNFRCVTISGQNTGEQEREEVYMNPCRNPAGYTVNWSNNGQIKRWVNIGMNTGVCPKPAYYTCDDLSNDYRKSNCGQDYQGSEVYVSIPAGMFTSTISVQDANDLAHAYGFNQANLDPNGTCTPIAFPLYFANSSTVPFNIELLDPATNNTVYTFFGTSSPNVGHSLGSILPGTYHVVFSPIYMPAQSYITYEAGCGYTTTGINEVIYNVTFGTNSTCNNLITIY
jgi:hypothetical protein